MVSHHFSLLCQNAVVDQFSGAPSFFNEVNGLNSTQQEIPVPPLKVCSHFYTDEPGESFEYKIEVISPSDTKVYEREDNFKIEDFGQRIFWRLQDFNLDTEGWYRIKILYRENSSNEWSNPSTLILRYFLVEEENTKDNN